MIFETIVMRYALPVSPGEMLEEEFLKHLGLTKYRLAKDIGIPAQRIGEIVVVKALSLFWLKRRLVDARSN